MKNKKRTWGVISQVIHHAFLAEPPEVVAANHLRRLGVTSKDFDGLAYFNSEHRPLNEVHRTKVFNALRDLEKGITCKNQ
jgi:hypothetical protein